MQNYWQEIVLVCHLARRFPFNFFIHAGVFGVGSVLYLPEKKDPPFLVIIPPKGVFTVAILPEPVAPAVAFSIMNSLALIVIYP
jgi:hypothetical protein